MNETAAEQDGKENAKLPTVRIEKPGKAVDIVTVAGIVFTFGLIIAAILSGSGNANFVNGPSIMIVVLGTLTATATSFTLAEVKASGRIIGKSIFRRVQDPKKLAVALVEMAVVAKTKGMLSLGAYEQQMKSDPFLAKAIQMAVDGYSATEIEPLLVNEIETISERHNRAANICKRASEVAPAMGLIGTLVGLVQMLADLENPETIGPAMAIALLTTFYGAILGTIVMGPLAVKLENNSSDETLIKTLIALAAVSIARQDNPRRLEMMLNSELPPSKRIRYFD